jgi:uncharacterized protein YbjT (DUF2867 family)
MAAMTAQASEHIASFPAKIGEPEPKTVLLTGATGYVGGRLLHRLEASGHHRVRCLTRRPEALATRTGEDTEVVAGDVLDAASLRPALNGVEAAYYLIHSMETSTRFEALDRTAARNFARAARSAGVRRIIYLGGLGSGDRLSPHLASRQEVGAILGSSGVPTIELRASIVIGSGSASYELVRALVESLPVVIAPPWVETGAQPIAIEDLLDYLLAALAWEDARSAIFEIGGAEPVTYSQIIREYARQRGLRRRLVHSSLLTPRVSSFFLGLMMPVYGQVAAALVESLRNETIVRTSAALEAFPIQPRGLEGAVERALLNDDLDFAETRWSDALTSVPPSGVAPTPFGHRLISSRVLRVNARAGDAFDPIRRIGGHTGWYAGNWFWRARGLLDTVRGGVGFRRGRRDPVDLRVDDTIDFWRVEAVEPGRRLRLAAEMKIPGRLWLQFEIDPHDTGGVQIRQTTVFDPAGYIGLAYWYLFCPVHHLVFGIMLRGIGRAVRGAVGHREAAVSGRMLIPRRRTGTAVGEYYPE